MYTIKIYIRICIGKGSEDTERKSMYKCIGEKEFMRLSTVSVCMCICSVLIEREQKKKGSVFYIFKSFH